MSFGLITPWQVPGVGARQNTIEGQVWFGDKEQQLFTNTLLLSTAVDAGHSGNTTLLRPGLLMGKVTATGKVKEWNPTGTDGSEYIWGVMLYDQQMSTGGTVQDRWFGFCIVKGNLKAAALIVPGNASAGILGDALEFIVRKQLQGRFLLDDDYTQNDFGAYEAVRIRTTDLTVTEAMNNALFVTLGAVGAVVFTLPTPRIGLRYVFYNAADQNMTIAAAAADGLITFNTLVGDSVAFSTSGNKIGGCVEVVGISATKWLVMPRGAGTMTVA